MSKKIYFSIIAGKYKGKKLEIPPSNKTRSTKSILRESFFNSVAFDIDGVIFIEVFGGSGSMGLEALSRGARKTYFIEKDKDAFEILKKNCSNLDPSSTYPIYGDSFQEFGDIVKKIDKDMIIYLDPPFDIRDGMEGIYEKVLELIKSIDSSGVKLLAIEHMSKKDMPELIGQFKKIKYKKFGKSSISYYKVE